MDDGKFRGEAAHEENPRWETMVSRRGSLYGRSDDIRSEFGRDYTRILHSNAYRRLKRKTQVFFATGNDHVCTRIEHVNHVASVGFTIAQKLGLNTELVNAIAMGHDLGHPPFGHEGERILADLEQRRAAGTFWHERNSLWFVERLETLPDDQGRQHNLDLTYAVRDGIVCHCGEVSESAISPRSEAMDLFDIQKPGGVEPFSWEGCVVKVADKIAYLGRDLEDARTVGILGDRELEKLGRLAAGHGGVAGPYGISNSFLIHSLVTDLCDQSSPQVGIRLSPHHWELIRELREFSREHIYEHPRLRNFKKYANLIIHSIFEKLASGYDGPDTLRRVSGWHGHPLLLDIYVDWLVKYTDLDLKEKAKRGYENEVVYRTADIADYHKSAIDFIAGMTDQYAIRVFEEMIRF